MSMPVSGAQPGVADLGAVVGEYPPSATRRITRLVTGAIALYLSLVGSIGFLEFGTFWRILLFVLAAASAVQFYFSLGAYARVFQAGFTVFRRDVTFTCRWDEIANITHTIEWTRMFGVIPEPWSKMHTYTVTLASGKKHSFTGEYIAHVEQMGETVARLWKSASAARERQAP